MRCSRPSCANMIPKEAGGCQPGSPRPLYHPAENQGCSSLEGSGNGSLDPNLMPPSQGWVGALAEKLEGYGAQGRCKEPPPGIVFLQFPWASPTGHTQAPLTPFMAILMSPSCPVLFHPANKTGRGWGNPLLPRTDRPRPLANLLVVLLEIKTTSGLFTGAGSSKRGARGLGQWHRAMVSMLRKRTCILVSMSMPCQIWG